MKRKSLLMSILLASTLLVGCGASSTDDSNKDVSTEKPAVQNTVKDEKEEGFTGVKSKEYKTDKDVILAEVTFENGQAVNVKIDVTTDGKSKVEESKAGNYVMKAGEENAWHEQVALLETFIKENNFDLSKVTLSDDAGHTDAVAGVTIKVPDYIKAVQEVLNEVKNGSTQETDAVASASFPVDEAGLQTALSADGTWIICVTGDLTTDKELVVDGKFHSKNDTSKDVARKLALYDQDSNKTVTASHTLTAPKITVKSENFKIQEGTFKGDIYVEANGFTLKNTKVEGNVYFANEEVKASFVLDGAEVTGVTEVK